MPSADLPTIEEFFASVPGASGFSYTAQILLTAYYLRKTGRTDFSTTEMTEAFQQASLPVPSKLRDRLAHLAKGKKARLLRIQAGRYSLSLPGHDEVRNYFANKPGAPRETVAILEKTVGRISDETERRFLAEAVACVEVGAKRAAIVMTWLLALDHIQEYILRNKVADFNNALASRTDTKQLQIATKDDFGDLKESVFIQVLRGAGLISNDVRKILDEKLGTRNSCAHPSNIEIHDSKVQNFVEEIVDNVIRKFPL